MSSFEANVRGTNHPRRRVKVTVKDRRGIEVEFEISRRDLVALISLLVDYMARDR